MHFVEELFDHAQTQANDLVTDIEHPLLGHLRMVGPAFQMSDTRLEATTPSPLLGADTDDILASAGYGATDSRLGGRRYSRGSTEGGVGGLGQFRRRNAVPLLTGYHRRAPHGSNLHIHTRHLPGRPGPERADIQPIHRSPAGLRAVVLRRLPR
jgi:hypothetical protein